MRNERKRNYSGKKLQFNFLIIIANLIGNIMILGI